MRMGPSSHPLSAFPDIPFDYCEILRSGGLATTADLLEKVRGREAVQRLSRETGIPDYRIGELLELSRLCHEEGLDPREARTKFDLEQ